MSYIPQGQYQDLGGNVLDKIGSGLKTFGTAALDIYTKGQTEAAKAEAYKEMALAKGAPGAAGGTPKWLLPVGIGAAALVAILVLKK